MIISRTPFRISFTGGGSDISDFYLNHGGAVLSTTIDKYVYLSMHPYFAEKKSLLKYSENELVSNNNEIKHPIIKEVFNHFDITGVDLSSSADIPGGTGMASSSAFTAGLINVCASYKGIYLSKKEISDPTCKIEIENLREPIGKQDQYACAYGGLNLIEFHKNDDVTVEKINLKPTVLKNLNDNLILFYLGKTRSASSILSEQKKTIKDEAKVNSLRKMVNLTFDLKTYLLKNDIDKLGEILHEGWILKKNLSNGISSPVIDELYESGIKAGALGGKLLGAGGGGFLLFYVKDQQKKKVINKLKNLVFTDFNFEQTGTTIIY